MQVVQYVLYSTILQCSWNVGTQCKGVRFLKALWSCVLLRIIQSCYSMAALFYWLYPWPFLDLNQLEDEQGKWTAVTSLWSLCWRLLLVRHGASTVGLPAVSDWVQSYFMPCRPFSHWYLSISIFSLLSFLEGSSLEPFWHFCFINPIPISHCFIIVATSRCPLLVLASLWKQLV